ncbi:MAG: type II toxin-antitoxin system HicA family toxin [Candidatus Methanospirareceae archaeon]
MPKLPLLPARKVVRAFIRLGFYVDHQKGSHIVLKDEATKTKTIVVPNHPEIDRKTLKSILKQAEIDLDTLLEVLTVVK